MLLSRTGTGKTLLRKTADLVDVSVRRGQDEACHGVDCQVAVQVFQVAVIAHIDCRARMDEVRDQEVGVEVLRGRERTYRWIRKHGVVLENHSGGKVTCELIVPLAADD